MVHVNANLDLQTYEVFMKGQLTEDLVNLSDEDLYITFVARDRKFISEAQKNEKDTFMRVVLPYEEVLSTNNIDLLAYRHLYQHLEKLTWMDHEKMKHKLKKIITRLESSSAV